MNYFSNKDNFFENNKYSILNTNDISDKILYSKNNIYIANSIDNNDFLLDKNNNDINNDLTSIININTSHNDNIYK